MALKIYKHFRDYPLTQWRWPNFRPEELASRGEGELAIDPRSMDMLQALRDRLGRPLIINSAYRSKAWNTHVGGEPNSFHMVAQAYDISMTNQNPAEFEQAAVAVGFRGIGHYPHSNFMHIDTRKTLNPVRFKGKGKNNAWFKEDPVTPNFHTNETTKPSVKDRLTDPGVIGPAVGAVPSLVAATQGTGPMQYAFAAVFVVLAIVGAVYFLRARWNNA